MAWSPVCDDTFTHADTATGGAGTTTGVPTPASGREWTDANGSVWQILSNDCVGTPDGTPTTAYLRDFLKRPAVESRTNSRILADFPTGMPDNGFAGVGLRLQGGGDYYLCHLDTRDSKTFVYKIVGGAATGLTSGAWSASYDNTHTYSLDLWVSGTNSTDISFYVRDTTAGTQVHTGTTTDSAASLQVTGVPCLVTWVRSGAAVAVTYTRVRTFEFGLEWYAPNAYEQTFLDD